MKFAGASEVFLATTLGTKLLTLSVGLSSIRDKATQKQRGWLAHGNDSVFLDSISSRIFLH